MNIKKISNWLLNKIRLIESEELVVSIGPTDSNRKIAEKWVKLAKENKNKRVHLASSGYGYDDYWVAYTDKSGLIVYSNGITMGGGIENATRIVKRWARDDGVRDKTFNANYKESIKKIASKLKEMVDKNSPGGVGLDPNKINAVFAMYLSHNGYEGYIGERKPIIGKDGDKIAWKVVKAWKKQFKKEK